MADKSNGPNLSELARLMLKWEVLERERIALEGAICDTVMQIGETQTAGNVEATYSSGLPDYEKAANDAEMPNDIWNVLHVEYTSLSVDWRGFCQDERAGIEAKNIPVIEPAPSVRLKLIQ